MPTSPLLLGYDAEQDNLNSRYFNYSFRNKVELPISNVESSITSIRSSLHKKNKCVSILILNYNGERFMQKLFSSLKEQSYRNFEVVFVDNASTDKSVAVLQEILARNEFKNLEVKIVLNEQNLGFCWGNNLGLKHVKGEYIVFLNNDTYVSKTWLEELVKTLEMYPSVAACQSKMVFASTNEVQTIGNLCDKYGFVTLLCKHNEGDHVLIDTFFYPCGGSLIIRKKIADMCGPFDEKLFFGDRDLGWRLRLQDHSIGTALNSVCYHFAGHSTRKLFRFVPDVLCYHNYKDIIRILVKNYSLTQLVRKLPLSLIFMLGEATSIALRFRDSSPFLGFLKALSWNLRNLKDTFIRRIKIQRVRAISDREIQKYMNPHPFQILAIKKKISF